MLLLIRYDSKLFSLNICWWPECCEGRTSAAVSNRQRISSRCGTQAAVQVGLVNVSLRVASLTCCAARAALHAPQTLSCARFRVFNCRLNLEQTEKPFGSPATDRFSRVFGTRSEKRNPADVRISESPRAFPSIRAPGS